MMTTRHTVSHWTSSSGKMAKQRSRKGCGTLILVRTYRPSPQSECTLTLIMQDLSAHAANQARVTPCCLPWFRTPPIGNRFKSNFTYNQCKNSIHLVQFHFPQWSPFSNFWQIVRNRLDVCITDNIARVGEEDADSDPRYAIRLV